MATSIVSSIVRDFRTALGITRSNSRRSQAGRELLYHDTAWVARATGSQKFSEVVAGIEWAEKTGRLTADADAMVRSLNGYEFVRFAVYVQVHCDGTANSVTRFLNEYQCHGAFRNFAKR